MKTLLQNSEKERDKCCLLFKTRFMKSLVAQFTLEPLFMSFVSFFAAAARLERVCFINNLVKLHFTNIILIKSS